VIPTSKIYVTNSPSTLMTPNLDQLTHMQLVCFI